MGGVGEETRAEMERGLQQHLTLHESLPKGIDGERELFECDGAQERVRAGRAAMKTVVLSSSPRLIRTSPMRYVTRSPLAGIARRS